MEVAREETLCNDGAHGKNWFCRPTYSTVPPTSTPYVVWTDESAKIKQPRSLLAG